MVGGASNHPACGLTNVHERREVLCRNCIGCGEDVAAALGLPTRRLGEFITEARARDLGAHVDQMAVHNLVDVEHAGLPIGKYARDQARWYLCVSDLGFTTDGDAVLRSFLKSALIVAEASNAILDAVKPDVLFMLNGLFASERILMQRARQRGTRVVTYEAGIMPETLIFAQNDCAGYMSTDQLWLDAGERVLTPAEDARLDDYVAQRRRGLKSAWNFWPSITESDASILAALQLDQRTPVCVLFTNVTWDSAAQGRDRGFPDQYSWIVRMVELFRRAPEASLVIRIHPAEVVLPGLMTRDPVLARLKKTFDPLPHNIRVVPPDSDLSSYKLMDFARCGLVYTSTTGLEMALQGMPVVVAGKTHYARKGFTIDPDTPEQYDQAVRAALTSPRSPQIRELARRYANALFFRLNVPFPLVNWNAPNFVPTLTSSDPAVLDPGGDRALDVICEGIMAGAPIFADG